MRGELSELTFLIVSNEVRKLTKNVSGQKSGYISESFLKKNVLLRTFLRSLYFLAVELCSYLPALVIIISVPNLWNFFQRSWPNNSTVVPFFPTKNPGELLIPFVSSKSDELSSFSFVISETAERGSSFVTTILSRNE